MDKIVKNNNVRKIRIRPGEVIQIVHHDTGTVLSVAVDLDSDYMRIKHHLDGEGLGFSWDRSSEQFIDALINQGKPE